VPYLWALALNQKQGEYMKQANLNRHGQPFSKKQKKASRHMMAIRRGFTPRSASSSFNMSKPDSAGVMATIGALLFGMKMRRKAS
jgi:hypothetical protein